MSFGDEPSDATSSPSQMDGTWINSLTSMGRFVPSRNLIQCSKRFHEAILISPTPPVTIVMGGVLKALGDHADAKAAYEHALKIFEKFLPPNHPNIKIVRGNLESL